LSQNEQGGGQFDMPVVNALYESPSPVPNSGELMFMLIPQQLSSLSSHSSQCRNLAIPADALLDAFGIDHPLMHVVG